MRRLLRGLVATGRGIPRPGMGVMLTADVPVGEVTSGTFSPTLKKGVGLALIAAGSPRAPRSPSTSRVLPVIAGYPVLEVRTKRAFGVGARGAFPGHGRSG